MQIAKMFASLGFKVDLSGLSNFKSSLANARGEMTNLGRGVGTTTRKLRGLSRALDSIDSRLNRVKGSAVNQSITKGYNDIAASVRRIDSAFNSISTNQKNTTKALGKIHASVKAGVPLWVQYKTSVLAVRDALRQVNARIDQIRAKAGIRINLGSGGTGSGGSGGGRGNGNGWGNGGSNRGFDLSGGGFFRSMLPAVALAGGLPSLGFAAKEVVNQGREQTKMESILQVTSKNMDEFGDTLKYVRDEAMRLGLSSVELGRSFAQINMSAGDKLSQSEKKEMFTGMSEFMMSMGTSKDDQKGIFRAMNQMFSNTRILQEEINQLSERGIPATLVWNAAKKAYGIEDITKIKKMQESGKLDPSKVLPVMAKMMRDMAHESGAFDKMLNSSIVKQGQFFEKLSQMSKRFMDSGVDIYLGKMFGLLSDIATKVDNITTTLTTFKKSLDEVSGGSGLLSIALLLLLGRTKKIAQIFRVLILAFRTKAGLIRTTSALLTGVFGRAIASIIIRFGGWLTIIYAVTKALSFLGDQLKRKDAGEFTFFDFLFHKVEMFGLKFQLVIAKIKLAWAHFKHDINPKNWFKFGEEIPTDGLKGVQPPPMGSPESKKIQEALKKMNQLKLEQQQEGIQFGKPVAMSLGQGRTQETRERVLATVPITIDMGSYKVREVGVVEATFV